MTLQPPLTKALLAVLDHAILQCRLGNRDMEWPRERTEDLMDAVHNIPPMLLQPYHMSAAELRQRLDAYDKEWPPQWPGEERLCVVFDRAMVQ